MDSDFGSEGGAEMSSEWISNTGSDSDSGVSGADVAIPIEEDRLNREAKLDRLDLELSVRFGDCLAGVGEAGS